MTGIKAKTIHQKSKMSNILIMLIVVFVIPAYCHGFRVIILMAIAVASAFIIDSVCLRLIGKRRHEKYDYSYMITALIITLLLPASAPYWMPAAGVLVALCVAKFPFGGNGCNIFNPAAVGLGFLGLCWPELMFSYPKPPMVLPLLGSGFDSFESPLHTVAHYGTPNVTFTDAILGNFPGPMGSKAMLVLVACGIFLLARKVILPEIPIALFVSSSLFAVIHQRVPTGALDSLVFETISGTLVFGAIFMANDPATIPTTRKGSVLYGGLLGAFTMLFRYFGINEFSFIYSLLIVNALSDYCDLLGYKLAHLYKRGLRYIIRKLEERQKSSDAVKEAPPEEKPIVS